MQTGIVKNWAGYLPYFSAKEFTCHCGCGQNNMTKEFMDMLYAARDEAQISFKINSGYRCPLNNELAGGAYTSDHLFGEGADISAHNSRDRFKILKSLMNAGFKRVGIHSAFIHAGTTENNPQEVTWVY